MEAKHIIIAYGVNDGIGVQGFRGLPSRVRLASEELGCGGVLTALIGVYGEDGRTCEAKHHVALHPARDELMHFSKLASVAFVKDEHDVLLLQDFAKLLVTIVDAGLHQVRQLLNRRDDDVAIVVLHLPLQHTSRCVRVGAVGFEVVVLLHRLVVQVFPIDHEEYFLDFWHLRGQLCRLERGERFARACCVPNVASCLCCSLPTVVDGGLDAQQYLLCGCNLVGTHHHQLLIDVEDAISGQDVQDGVLGKERGGEVAEVCQPVVLLVGPVTGELEGVAVGLASCSLPLAPFSLFGVASGIGVVFRFCAVRDDEDLHEVEHSPSCPERVAQIAVDLVEGFFDGNAPTFQFDLHQGQAVHQNGDVVAVLECPSLFHILVGDLQTVVVDVLLVDESDVLRFAAVEREGQDVALALQHLGLVLYLHLLVRYHGEQPCPLAVAELDAIQGFQLFAQVAEQTFLVADDVIDIALRHQLIDEGRLQLRLALIALSRSFLHLVMRHYRLVLLFHYNLVVVHKMKCSGCL